MLIIIFIVNFTHIANSLHFSYFLLQNVQVKIQEWNIEDILWYFGFEPRHFPQTKWAMTFILKKIPPKRTKVSPYFGNTIGGNDTNMRNKLVSTMIRTEYSNGLAPPLMNIPAS